MSNPIVEPAAYVAQTIPQRSVNLPTAHAIASKLSASRESIQLLPAPSLAKPIRAPPRLLLPKPKTPQHDAMLLAMAELVLPNVEGLDLPEVNRIVQAVSEELTTILSVAQVRKSSDLQQRINDEFRYIAAGAHLYHILTIATLRSLLSKLRFTSYVFKGVITARTFVLARKVLGQLKQKAESTSRGRARKRLNLHQLFKLDQRGAWMEVLGSSEAPVCDIPAEVMTAYHVKTYRGLKSAVSQNFKFDLSVLTDLVEDTRPRPCTEEENEGVTFSMPELDSAIKHANKKSKPGLDQITVKLLGLGGLRLKNWLLAVFEVCRGGRFVIDCWQRGVSQPVYKSGDKSNPANWRYLTLLSAMYKLFFSMISVRIFAHDRMLRDENPRCGFFSSSQRGFRPNLSGCTDNIALLRLTQQLLQNRGEKVWLCWFDFMNAFGSPDHLLLWEMLAWINVPSYLLDVIKAAYDGASVRIHLSDDLLTPEIEIEVGVLTGCLGSPTIFNFPMDLLLRFLEKLSSFQFVPPDELQVPGVGTGVPLGQMAYADDLLAIARTKWDASRLCMGVGIFCLVTGMAVKASKSAVIEITSRRNVRTACDPHLLLNGIPLPGLSNSQTYKFLGAEAGGTGSSAATRTRLVAIITKHAPLIAQAWCDPWLKSVFFIRFVLPKVTYSLGCWTLKTSELSTLNALIRRTARDMEGLRSSVCNAAINAPVEFGGLGYTSVFPCTPDLYFFVHQTIPLW